MTILGIWMTIQECGPISMVWWSFKSQSSIWMTTFAPCDQSDACATSGQIAANLGNRALTTPEGACPGTEHAWMGVIGFFFKYFRGLPGSGKKFEWPPQKSTESAWYDGHSNYLLGFEWPSQRNAQIWMTNLKYDPNQHGMVVIQIPIFDLNDHLWVMESDKCICCERPNRGDPRGPSIGSPREHAPRHRTRMDGGDCDFFQNF